MPWGTPGSQSVALGLLIREPHPLLQVRQQSLVILAIDGTLRVVPLRQVIRRGPGLERLPVGYPGSSDKTLDAGESHLPKWPRAFTVIARNH